MLLYDPRLAASQAKACDDLLQQTRQLVTRAQQLDAEREAQAAARRQKRERLESELRAQREAEERKAAEERERLRQIREQFVTVGPPRRGQCRRLCPRAETVPARRGCFAG